MVYSADSMVEQKADSMVMQYMDVTRTTAEEHI